MKIVQSFWSCHNKNLLQFKAGWISPEYNLMSWALSCLQLRKYYNNIHLYADDISARMLIDTLKLPYAEVQSDLNKLDRYHPQLWALPKLYAYAQQQCPFLHVDGDVFIWEPFKDELLKGDLIAQNEEAATVYYEAIMKSLESNLSYFPLEILEHRQSKEPIHAYNAGIMGGNDIAFFKSYTSKSLHFVENNLKKLDHINVTNFNIFFEQYLFYCLVRKENKEVSVLIKDIIGDNEYKGLGDFAEVPYKSKYLHLLGDYKRNKAVCDQLASKLREDYPEFYYRIISLFKTNKVSLKRDYFWFDNDFSESSLFNRHNLLKDAFNKNELYQRDPSRIQKSISEICFRAPIAKSIVQSLNGNGQIEANTERYFTDLEQFEKRLTEIVLKNFSDISCTYLFARDLLGATYAEYLFGNSGQTYGKVIVADSLVEIIESQFDWSEIEMKPSFVDPPEGAVYTLVVPESDQHGYSLSNVDDLDLMLLQTIKDPIPVCELFEQVKSAFDPEDLQNSKPEFERLIFGRIKRGLLNKSIRVIIER